MIRHGNDWVNLCELPPAGKRRGKNQQVSGLGRTVPRGEAPSRFGPLALRCPDAVFVLEMSLHHGMDPEHRCEAGGEKEGQQRIPEFARGHRPAPTAQRVEPAGSGRKPRLPVERREQHALRDPTRATGRKGIPDGRREHMGDGNEGNPEPHPEPKRQHQQQEPADHPHSVEPETAPGKPWHGQPRR